MPREQSGHDAIEAPVPDAAVDVLAVAHQRGDTTSRADRLAAGD